MIGTALGGALTSKYVAILLPVSLAAWCVATGRSRALPALLRASALAILLFAPVVWWNAHHDWSSLRYQFASRHLERSFHVDRFAPYLGLRGWPVAAAWPSGPRPTPPLMSRSRRVWSSTLHAPERLASVRAHRTFHIVRAAAGPGTTHILTIGEA